MKTISHSKRNLGFAISTLALAMGLAGQAGAVVVSGQTPTQAIDPVNVTGVGQMVIDQKNGFIGLCTATLINPRTVIFAAHCVNENPAGNGFQAPGGYGAANGGLPIGFFFNASNNAAGNSAIGQWLNGVGGGAKDLTRVANNAYNSNYVWYNPASTALGLGSNFLEGDIALAALDTPASKIPTWTLLFSPLGSTQHVTIDGYGNNGTAATGSTGSIDFRRRTAENMVSLLGSINNVEGFLFGGNSGLPQNLYWIDFNDQKYGQAGASPYDFNIFNDGPGLPKEGITASGDSGGPLIVDKAYAKPIIVGVLSGGYTRFFNGQPANGYGTASFYQPLYLFWDLVVANNPYKYVGTVAGDGKWTDANHWVINTDPNFMSLDSNGNLVNALPTTAGAGVSGTTPKFGSVCYFTDCLNVVTGVETINGVPINAVTAPPAEVAVGAVTDDSAKISANLLTNGLSAEPAVAAAASIESESALVDSSQVSFEDFAAIRAALLALAAPTIANGLPGATNFVPNDTNGNPVANIAPRYYDVTLAAAGTTTLDTTITVDRLTLNGAAANLNITSAGNLTSLIDTTVYAGTLNVNGRYTSAGDIALIGGLLSGSGTVNAGHTTSVLGAIAPGGLTQVGTLTFQGDVVLSSGNRLYINVDSGNRSSLLTSQANSAQGTLGVVNLGGLLSISGANGYIPHYGDNYLVVSAASAVTGQFSSITAVSQGVLYPEVVYSPKAVNVQIKAASYTTVIDQNSAIQSAYANLLNGDRGNYSQMISLYEQLDIMPAGAVQPTLESMAPFHAVQVNELSTMGSDALSDLYRERLDGSRNRADNSGVLSVIGKPLQMAELDAHNGAWGASPIMNDAAPAGATQATPVASLPKGVNAFIAAGYLDGKGTILPNALLGTAQNSLSGHYYAVGGELTPTRAFSIGASLAYGTTSAGLLSISSTHQDLRQLALYASYRFSNGAFLTGQGAVGDVRSKTERQFTVGMAQFNLTGRADGSSSNAEIQIGRDYAMPKVEGLTLTPLAGVRYQQFKPGTLTETGGSAALIVQNNTVQALEGRFGLNARMVYVMDGLTVSPNISATLVHDFSEDKAGVYASFAQGVTSAMLFGTPTHTTDWAELSTGLTLSGKNCDVNLGVKTNVGRKDVGFQTFQASARIRF